MIKKNASLESNLPPCLKQSLSAMKRSWEIKDGGGNDLHWDLHWCELNADITIAELEKRISAEQAMYLRRKYLRIEEN